jgi:hypothetical protein
MFKSYKTILKVLLPRAAFHSQYMHQNHLGLPAASDKVLTFKRRAASPSSETSNLRIQVLWDVTLFKNHIPLRTSRIAHNNAASHRRRILSTTITRISHLAMSTTLMRTQQLSKTLVLSKTMMHTISQENFSVMSQHFVLIIHETK